MPRISPRAQSWQVEQVRKQVGKPFQTVFRNRCRPVLIREVYDSTRTVTINDGTGDHLLTVEEVLRLLDRRRV